MSKLYTNAEWRCIKLSYLLILFLLFILNSLKGQNTCPSPVATIQNNSNVDISQITFVEVKYDFPAIGQSTWFYTIEDLSSPAVSHVVFDIACHTFPTTDFKQSVGTWTGMISNPTLNAGDGMPELVNPDPQTGVNGLKFDESFSDGEIRNYYFTINGNFLIDNMIVYATKEGNNTNSTNICGPDCDTALPVEITYFNAIENEEGILLKWETASETNNSHFELQRSYDTKFFETFAKVKGKGTSLQRVQYEYLDVPKSNGKTLYYRLKQVDFDGQFEHSEIITITRKNNSTKQLNVFPNPTSDRLTLQLPNSEEIESIKIYNAFGKLIQQSNTVEYTISFKNFDSGIYLLIINTDRRIYQTRIVKN